MSHLLIYVDEDAGENAVVRGLRARSIDVMTTVEAEKLGSDDSSQLEFASSIGRAIYTFNIGDFARLHNEYLTQNKTHSGIITVPDQRYSIGEKIRRLASFINCTNAKDMINLSLIHI